MNNKKLTKRIQVDKNQSVIFAFISIASVVTVASFMISRAIWTGANYTNNVIEKKEVALDQLEENKNAIVSLTEAYNEFNDQNPNLIGGNPDGTEARDGSNSTLILDSLPYKYDFPAVVASVEKLLTGYSINSITGSDDAVNQSSSSDSELGEIPFSFSVNTNYDGLKNLISTFDKSIRPFKLTKISAAGTGGSLQVEMDMTTYYQPETGVQIKKERVQ